MTNNYGENVYGDTSTNTGKEEGWKTVTPNAVEDDDELQSALNGEGGAQGERDLNLNSNTWGGMESGAIQYDSTQSQNWLNSIPKEYQSIASHWANQQGMLRIIPVQQRQKFTYSTVAYIATKQEEPKTQTFPISDVSVVPHQITFDFYDTTEGRVGVSNAVEKHMQVECDVYLTDLLAQYWIFGDDNQYNLGLSLMPNLKREYWASVENGSYLSFEADFEKTKEFAEFRSTFLQQHSGWVCKFISHTFGAFQGVITDVSYSINGGETFAKWHIKFEEAIFMEGAYQTNGQKPSDSSSESQTSDDASQENSGDVTNQE